MSFAEKETSRHSGSPISLYFFRYGEGPTAYHAYTDAEQPITGPGDTATPVVYTPIPIMRANTESSGTLDKAAMSVNLPGDAAIAELFRLYPPAGKVTAVIRQGHLSDLDADYPAVWVGRVINCAWPNNSQARLTLEPVSTSMRRTGLKRNYQYGCPLVLYGTQCGASKAARSVAVVIDGFVTANVISMPTGWNPFAIDKYRNGLVEWTTPQGNIEYRTILRIVGGQHLQVSGVVRGLEAGQSISVALGCNHQMDDCEYLHVEATTGGPNIVNYGGQPWIPVKNPLSSTNIYY